MKTRPTTRLPHVSPTARGISMIETVIALLILSGAFVAVLNTVASSRGMYFSASSRAAGLTLAEDLMDEVLQQPYREPGSTLLGLESGETLLGGRADFDDLDDYDGWSSIPPMDAAGNTLSDFAEYTRAVAVDWVNPLSPDTTTTSDSGVKRVIVSVYRGEKRVAELTAYRSSSYTAAGESQ